MTPSPMSVFLSVMAVFQVLDVYTTYRVLKLGGVERSPVIAWLIALFGNALLVLISVKVLLIAVLYYNPLPGYAQAILIGVYVCILHNNFSVLKKLKNA